MKKFILTFIAFITCVFATNAQVANTEETKTIKLEANNKFVYINLKNNKAANEFYEMLPLSINMNIENNCFLTGELSDTLSVEEAEIQTTNRGGLYYYPNLKQLIYIYDVYINKLTSIQLGQQRGLKNIFMDTFGNVEVKISKFE